MDNNTSDSSLIGSEVFLIGLTGTGNRFQTIFGFKRRRHELKSEAR